MITRDIAGVFPVSGMIAGNYHSCSGTYTSACGPIAFGAFTGAIPGYCIDRQALPANYNSVAVVVTGMAVISATATACHAAYHAISVGLQHAACSTAGWADYSTGSFVSCQPGYFKSTSTSTADAWWDNGLKKAYGVQTTAYTTSTSTGYAEIKAIATFDLTGAERFIRCTVSPRIEQWQSSGATASCGGGYTNLSATLLFGSPDEAPFSYDDQGVVITTTAGSTATST